jgi:hypothetical protein
MIPPLSASTYLDWFNARPSFRPSVVPLLAALAFGSGGCVIHAADDDEGTLTVEWTVDDSTDSDACFDFDGRDLELIVYDSRDDVAADLRAPCDEFEVAIDLPDGSYGIDATLLDRSGRAVTTTLALDDIDVFAGEETVIPIDFPVDSLR